MSQRIFEILLGWYYTPLAAKLNINIPKKTCTKLLLRYDQSKKFENNYGVCTSRMQVRYNIYMTSK